MKPITFTCDETLPLPSDGIARQILTWTKWPDFQGYPPVSGDKVLEKVVGRYAGPRGNLQFPTRSANSLRLDRTDREAAGKARLGKGGGEAEIGRAEPMMGLPPTPPMYSSPVSLNVQAWQQGTSLIAV